MCDTVSTSIVLAVLSLVPENRYILLGLSLASLITYAANRQRPLHKLGQVEGMIKVVEETLERAQANSARNHVEVMDETSRLLEAKISASKIQDRLLKTQSVTTWNEFVEYLQDLREITQSISQCAKEVKEVRTSILLTIEAERRRQFSERIKECHEILDSVVSSSARRPHAARRHFASPVTGNTSQKSSMV
ncbi:hypothetical protein MVEN_00959500 [Mycena venus]|uniref:Uncharacterized protein n=1 Tax=Mycena venus TaxID=2733690 RepID=A0A8H7D1S8_9AGAR|nr:hypothetical protein MVEN_00959500 [Mycena venus]